MKKFSFNKCELMENKNRNEQVKNDILVKEDGFICNGILAIKEEYTLIRKNLKVSFLNLQQVKKHIPTTLPKNAKTLKDILKLHYDCNNKIDKNNIVFDEHKATIMTKTNRIGDIYFCADFLKRILNISENIELYFGEYRYSPLQIVLNNEVIGIFMPTT